MAAHCVREVSGAGMVTEFGGFCTAWAKVWPAGGRMVVDGVGVTAVGVVVAAELGVAAGGAWGPGGAESRWLDELGLLLGLSVGRWSCQGRALTGALYLRSNEYAVSRSLG